MHTPSNLFARFALASVLALTPLATLSGCDTPGATQAGEGAAEVSMQALSAADVASATLTVSGAALTAPRTQTLFKRDGNWGASLNGLPAGSGYTFTATAFDANGVAIYTGSAGNITIVAKQSVPVNITANQITDPSSFKNSAPIIDSLNISSSKVVPGDGVSLAVLAHDPDAGDTLTYAWSATGGTLGSTSATQTSWTAPATEGNYELTILVKDNRGAKTAVKTTVKVDAKNGHGGADVTLTFNDAPAVSSVLATPGWLEKGVATAVVATASDSDSNTLSYSWTSDCAGSFANRVLAKAVDTGWADGTCATASPIATVVGSTSPMYGPADARLVTLSYDPTRVTAAMLASGHFGLAVRDAVSGNWVNAATSGTPTFVSGPASATAPLGTYGVDPASNTAWAIVDHDGDFTVTSF